MHPSVVPNPLYTPLPTGLLSSLQASAGPRPASPPAGEGEYAAIPEAALLEQRLVQPVSLDMDDDSDAELEGLEGMYVLPFHMAADQPVRFKLLRELWASAR